MELLATLIALLATMPYITFFIIFFVYRKLTNQATRSTKLAADLSNVFFLLAVNAILFIIFNHSFLVYFFLLLLIGVIIVICIQWKKEEEVNIRRAFRVVWRLAFIVFAISYTALIPFGIFITY
ncbi:DUF3397 domain-containing protein [Piscibacillus sp. B03]|uniref:DUF3397 domain-containing protein n=1 Tax=Piscibacillus sp. B03 TaxID=3457430 RepID=UPI003FCE0591